MQQSKPLTIAFLRFTAGCRGIRDQSAIDSALARPQNLAAYGEPDAADLAAAYAFGPVKNHGFVDGNKRYRLAGGGTLPCLERIPLCL